MLVVGYHGLAGRDFALPHMHVVDGDLLGLLKGLEQELDRFDAAPEAVVQNAWRPRKRSCRPTASTPNACCLRTWAQICP